MPPPKIPSGGIVIPDVLQEGYHSDRHSGKGPDPTFPAILATLNKQGPGGGWSTNSATYVDFGGTGHYAVGFTKRRPDTNLLVSYGYSLYVAGATAWTIGVAVDLTTYDSLIASKNTANDHAGYSNQHLLDGSAIPAGTHTFTLRIKSSGGILNQDGSDYAYVTIVEIPAEI